MSTARLIIDRRGGSSNMAVDEALLLSAPRFGPALRFYQWDEPTLSLGYFQSAADRRQHSASANCPLVRRSTGGGAILHDLELTYSFVRPADARDKSCTQALYYAFHETLIQVLAEQDIQAALATNDGLVQPGKEEPFLCFQRRAVGDVLLGGAKICGSAQRRHRDAILQHGSVLLASSVFAPELPGFAELTGVRFSAEELAEKWVARLKSRLGLDFQTGSLSHYESGVAERLAQDRFGEDAWSSRR